AATASAAGRSGVEVASTVSAPLFGAAAAVRAAVVRGFDAGAVPVFAPGALAAVVEGDFAEAVFDGDAAPDFARCAVADLVAAGFAGAVLPGFPAAVLDATCTLPVSPPCGAPLPLAAGACEVAFCSAARSGPSLGRSGMTSARPVGTSVS